MLPEPSVLQAEQPQLSQSVYTAEVPQASDHSLWPSSGLAPKVHVLNILRASDLDAVLQVESPETGVERENHLPQPAAQASFDAAKDMVGNKSIQLCQPSIGTNFKKKPNSNLNRHSPEKKNQLKINSNDKSFTFKVRCPFQKICF